MNNPHPLERAFIKIEALAIAAASLSEPEEHELKCELIERIELVARDALQIVQLGEA
ncbi:hypothetical protein [Lelliottia aquatilis]|uniref:hypothetical protein n=1 Tax=Lelliottia aquatilis TaxID=2080838 RepID=UPI0013FE3840|nr:hypothetical protein [Lelliottia aquatilis]